MKLYRQDGSEVELNEVEAQKWLKLGLGTLEKKDTIDKAAAKPKETAKQKE